MLKIKTSFIVLGIDILSLILISLIFLFPDNIWRVLLGLPFVLFFPGYLLIAAFFPYKGGLDSPSRLLLGMAASLALTPLVCLVLNFTPWGIKLDPILLSLTAIILIFSILAIVRQSKISDQEKSALELRMPNLGRSNRANGILTIILACALLGSALAAIFVFALPKIEDKYTEFYILGAGQKIQEYPLKIKFGSSGLVMLNVVNHEKTTTNYRIEVMLNGIKSGEIGPISVDSDEKYSEPVVFTPKQSGDNQKMELMLFKNGQISAALTLQLPFDVEQ